MPDARVDPIEPFPRRGESVAHRTGSLAVNGALTLALWGCGATPPRPADAVVIPAKWSGSGALTRPGNPSLARW